MELNNDEIKFIMEKYPNDYDQRLRTLLEWKLDKSGDVKIRK